MFFCFYLLFCFRLLCSMKKIIAFRKLLGVSDKADLQELKNVYRKFMKEWHPDKFQEGDEQAKEAEAKSKQIIEAYHFLVSIAAETRAAHIEEYNKTVNVSPILDYEFKVDTLKIDFADGNSYEYYGVPKAIYTKFINSEARGRFARRHIYNSYIYKNVTKEVAV
jgi:curved DNA-binding protein CbpA